MRRALLWFLLLTFAAVLFIEARWWLERHPQELPWTDLSPDDPVGRFTAAKIAALGSHAPACRAWLSEAGVRDRPAPPRTPGEQCGYRDGTLLTPGGGREAGFGPPGLITSCPVAAALFLWDERVVQPAARQKFGSGVRRFLHAGSYSCRRLYNRPDGPWSEHATADAVDIVGFELEDGRTLSVLRDWDGEPDEAAFLRQVRDGACGLFTTVLSPDYNAARRDHLHLDTANRGRAGWRACR